MIHVSQVLNQADNINTEGKIEILGNFHFADESFLLDDLKVSSKSLQLDFDADFSYQDILFLKTYSAMPVEALAIGELSEIKNNTLHVRQLSLQLSNRSLHIVRKSGKLSQTTLEPIKKWNVSELLKNYNKLKDERVALVGNLVCIFESPNSFKTRFYLIDRIKLENVSEIQEIDTNEVIPLTDRKYLEEQSEWISASIGGRFLFFGYMEIIGEVEENSSSHAIELAKVFDVLLQISPTKWIEFHKS